MSDSNITNKHGIKFYDIQKDDVVHLDIGGSVIVGKVTRLEVYNMILHKVWGYWGGSIYEQYGIFDKICYHEPSFKPYDPTQVGDTEDDI